VNQHLLDGGVSQKKNSLMDSAVLAHTVNLVSLERLLWGSPKRPTWRRLCEDDITHRQGIDL